MFGPFWSLIARPSHSANLGHRREPVIKFSHIAVGFPRIAPRPVNTEAFPACDILTGLVDVVIRARRIGDDGLRFFRRSGSIALLDRHLGERRLGEKRT